MTNVNMNQVNKVYADQVYNQVQDLLSNKKPGQISRAMRKLGWKSMDATLVRVMPGVPVFEIANAIVNKKITLDQVKNLL